LKRIQPPEKRWMVVVGSDLRFSGLRFLEEKPENLRSDPMIFDKRPPGCGKRGSWSRADHRKKGYPIKSSPFLVMVTRQGIEPLTCGLRTKPRELLKILILFMIKKVSAD
jgi:hypothetical protein